MKILLALRKWEDDSGKIVKELKKKLELKGHVVEVISREDDLDITSLSGSMGTLKEFISIKDKKENYDIIYTQDWSIAFPLLVPTKVLKNKHFCFFHDVQEGENSKIFQKIVGNMMGRNLIVKTEELKKRFPNAILASNGIVEFKKFK